MALKKETIVISLGGSLVVPDNIDIEFLKSFKKSVLKQIKNFNFIIVVGGGKIARNYQKAISEFGAKNTDKDWIGINATKLNAELVKNIFSKKAQKKIIVSGGVEPGNSTDYVSVLMAKANKVKTIINLTNTDYVYDKDPSVFSDAKPLEKISWKDFRKIVGSKWVPGLSKPFDPKASKLAEKLKMQVVMINGKNLKSFENFLNNKPFTGTIINPVK